MVQGDVVQRRLHTHQVIGHQEQALPGQTVKMGKQELQKTMTGELTVQRPVEKVKVRRPLLMARLILRQAAARLMHFTTEVMGMNQNRQAGLAQGQDMLVQMVVMQRKKAQAVAALYHLLTIAMLHLVQAQTAA